MKYFKIIFFILVITLSSCKNVANEDSSKAVINNELKEKLEKILLLDQGIRELIDGNITDERKALLLTELNLKSTDVEGNKKFDLINEIDSINLLEIDSILKKHGYPSKSLVGEPANKAAFYVIQHSDKIAMYLPIIRKATKNGDIPKTSLAMMEDRNLMYQGIEQIYGTQIKGQANSKGEWIYYLWPIKNADSINIWRKKVGFEQDIEEYLRSMDIELKYYKIEDLKKL